jgi:hypothetical protein
MDNERVGIVRWFWDDWGYMSSYNLYILYDNGEYENYKVEYEGRPYSDHPDCRKEFTEFRKFARINSLNPRYFNSKEEVHEYLDRKVAEFAKKKQEEIEKEFI